jgi:acetyl-CoA synthetase
MSEPEIYAPRPESSAQAHVKSLAEYEALYARSIADPEGFWAEVAQRLDWSKPWDTVLRWDYTTAEVAWFEGGELNASVNCLDRHVDAGRGDRIAIIWEGDDPAEDRRFTYAELLTQVCRFANVLKGLGVTKGDRVCLYLPMIPELAIALLACARIGAIHSVVFAGFSAESLAGRLNDATCTVLLTADEGLRGGKRIPLKQISDHALAKSPSVATCVVVRRTGAAVPMQDGRDRWLHDLLPDAADTCDPVPMGAEDPLFILYTSGSTGKPKGLVHTTGGYLAYAAYTHELVFDWRPDDVYFCAADIGWITGHTYIVYGPLANGATSMMFEGIPTYPDVGRYWDIIDKHGVTLFYTAPTALRAIAKAGNAPVTSRSRATLRVLGTVGEPINPETWRWYHDVVGDGRCAIVDTWWQTETGGHCISPLPGATPCKPGSATFPLPGVRPVVMDGDGAPIDGNDVSGNLCIGFPWPGQARTIYGDHDRFRETYFSQYPGHYFTGDGCRRDADGYYWITGRVDDVLNVAGHRLGTAEVESALVLHHAVAEAAVVGFPHEIKGQGIYCYVTLKLGVQPSEELRKELVQQVRKEIGATAAPDVIQWAPGLPKTRSGKIMRRILRKIAENELGSLGDTSTLADPTVVDDLVKNRAAN